MIPKISVVMPVYNGEKYLREAMESILEQSFSDFEFIVVNDGSTDSSSEIIKSFSDPRIVYIDNGTNFGLSRSFNTAIRVARGTYIARMDADDVSALNRLERQLSFLKRHPHVDIVGSSLLFIDEKSNVLRSYHKQLDHVSIKFSSLFSTPMMHPTVMGKASVFKSHEYNENLHNSEDYDLWSRLLFETQTHFANIWEPLLKYRTYPHSFTQTLNLDKRIVSAHNTIKNMKRYLPLSEAEVRLIVSLRQEKNLSSSDLFHLFRLYARSAHAFSLKEGLSFKKSLSIYTLLIPHAVFLLKYRVKKLIKRI